MTAAVDTEHWMRAAACAGLPPEQWFPHASDRRTIARALQVCRTCPVQAACRAHADRVGAHHRIRAGQTRRLTDATPASFKPTVIRHGTDAGYAQHIRYGIYPCPPCRHAHAQYQQHRRTKLTGQQ